MEIYFVRHGQSESNLTLTVQGSEGGLTELGKDQAFFVAERIKKIGVEVIISSTLRRALETANIIASEIEKPIVQSDLFRELKWPSSIVGKKREAKETEDFLREHEKNIDHKNWKYEDEESFLEILKRASLAIEFLKKRTEKEIVVVTHGQFLRAIILFMYRGDKLSKKEFFDFQNFAKTTNTGITNCSFEGGQWGLKSWNDRAHLGS